MVTLDMSKARAQISKRQHRMRRAARRRVRRQNRLQLRQLQAESEARSARLKSVATWMAEEERLEKARHHASPSQDSDTSLPENHCQSHPASSRQPSSPDKSPRAVRFAQHVLVTEIPAKEGDKLPKPVSSPIGVSLCSGSVDSDTDSDEEDNLGPSPRVIFSTLADAELDEDDAEENDPEFSLPDDETLHIYKRPYQRPRRREASKRLESTSNQTDSHTAPSKRPRTETVLQPEKSRFCLSNPSATSERLSTNVSTSNRVASDDSETLKSVPTRLPSPSRRPRKKRKHSHDKSQDNSSVGLLPNGKPQTVPPTRSVNPDNEVSLSSQNGVASAEGERKDQSHHENEGAGGHKESPAEKQISPRSKKRKSRAFPDVNGHTSKSKKHATGNLKPMENGRSLPARGEQIRTASAGGKCESPQGKKEKSEEENELEQMFGDFVKQKAENRALQEKQAVAKKKIEDDRKRENEKNRGKRKMKHVDRGPMRYTEDGLRILTYDELAEDQPRGLDGDCPFDCSCCY